MEQRSISHSPSPDSWLRVALNTMTLAVRRRWIERADDQLLSPRGWVVLAVGIVALVVGGGAVYLMGPFGLDGSTSSTANGAAPGDPQSNPNDTTGGSAADPSAPVATDPTRSTTRSRSTPTSSQSKAAAGLEIAERIDIEVSSTASRTLRSGAIDGRILVVLAALSTERRVTAITAAPAAPARPVAVTPPPCAEPLIIPAAAETVNPGRLVIDRVGVSADVERVGLAADGTLDPPTNVSRVGWYSASSPPGGVGPSVMVGHLDSTKGPGVFARLSELTSGDVVSVVGDDPMSVSYVVTSVLRFPKERFPSEAVYGASPDAELRLVTCGGPYERGTGYVDNVVVSARATGI